ncbi:hypothetical protein [Amnibacterium endophyticum]|uniref:Sugar ABC transporter ATPase n=1 Tax=Amnibacterium endophyticum TaxID=2109337 RepID=A0ABW4LF43_9MICO
MSDTARDVEGDAADQNEHLTVEDSGTTTDPGDLAGTDEEPASGSNGIEDPGHVFDQTNGMADGLDGDSDGTAESDELSAAERDREDPTVEDDEVRADDDGVHDLRDR